MWENLLRVAEMELDCFSMQQNENNFQFQQSKRRTTFNLWYQWLLINIVLCVKQLNHMLYLSQRALEKERPVNRIVFHSSSQQTEITRLGTTFNFCDLNSCWSTMSINGFKVKDKTVHNIFHSHILYFNIWYACHFSTLLWNSAGRQIERIVY